MRSPQHFLYQENKNVQESLEEDKYLVDIICSYDNTFLETGDFSMTAELTINVVW